MRRDARGKPAIGTPIEEVNPREEKFFRVTLTDEKTGEMKLEVKGLAPSQVILLATGIINQAVGQILKASKSSIVKPSLKEAIEIDKSKMN